MIKAIIFDCFGVLTGEGLVPFREQHFGNNPELLKASKSLTHQMVLGVVTFEDMLCGFADMAGLTYEAVVEEIETLARVKNNELLDFIKNTLKTRYKIGVLSNIGEHKFETVFSREEQELFDSVTLSCDIGYVKPDPMAYETAAQMLDVEPDQAIFVDDRDQYVEGAKKVGMYTIKYISFTQFREDLERLIGEHNREKSLTFNHKNDRI